LHENPNFPKGILKPIPLILIMVSGKSNHFKNFKDYPFGLEYCIDAKLILFDGFKLVFKIVILHIKFM